MYENLPIQELQVSYKGKMCMRSTGHWIQVSPNHQQLVSGSLGLLAEPVGFLNLVTDNFLWLAMWCIHVMQLLKLVKSELSI